MQQQTNATVQGPEMIVTRLLDAPVEQVWEAWTSPHHVVKWWGPNGFTTTFTEYNFNPGGVWRFTMHGPDGVDYPNRITFREIVPNERLVYDHSDDSEPSNIHFEVTIDFEAKGNQTFLRMRSVFPSPEHLERVVKEFGALEGAIQHIGRLIDHLGTMHQ